VLNTLKNKSNILFCFPKKKEKEDVEKMVVSFFWAFKSISSCAQYAILRKYFPHPSFVMYSFATLPKKLELGQQVGWGIIYSKPHGPIIMMGQSETLRSS
jgi:hypothetical protein